MAEDEQKGRHAAHVSRASHGRGGGHMAPGAVVRAAVRARPRVAAKIATAPRSFIAVHAANPAMWSAFKPEDYDEDIEMVHPLYVGMKFPDYEFREFPKFVGDRIAENEEEEAILLAGLPLVRDPEERVRMLAVCEVKNIKVDRRWGSEKIRKAIIAAGEDPSFDPSK